MEKFYLFIDDANRMVVSRVIDDRSGEARIRVKNIQCHDDQTVFELEDGGIVYAVAPFGTLMQHLSGIRKSVEFEGKHNADRT